jgi:dTMP kinase
LDPSIRPTRGLFFTFEGIEGSGKSTQAASLASRLTAAGHPVLLTREPGGVPLAESIRALLLATDSGPIQPLSELLLFIAARAQHVADKVRPALDAGHIVICDRFTDATLAYQGGGRSVPDDLLRRLNAVSTDGLNADRTYLLDVDVAAGFERTGLRDGATGRDRIERESADFFEAVRRRYLALAAEEPERFLVVRGTDSIADVARLIQEDAITLIRRRAPRSTGAKAEEDPT